MSGTKEIKRRIKSIKSTKKITKAMELVSAAKMRKMVSRTLNSRPYAALAWQILQSLEHLEYQDIVPLMAKREEGRSLIILISSNRGLCGVYNAQIAKKTIEHIRKYQEQDSRREFDLLTIGKKATLAARRMGTVAASFDEMPDDVAYADTLPISKYILDAYAQGTYERVIVAYTDFKSVLTQIPRIKQLLPVTNEELESVLENIDEGITKKSSSAFPEYLFEPKPEILINEMLTKLVKYQVLQMILESRASEESSRMMAMKNANEAAGEMIDDLTLVFNKARQAGITQEISEISAGTAALE